MTLCDFYLFFDKVTAEVYYLHTVKERAVNGSEGVGRSDEQDFRQVKIHIYVVVMEVAVLLRVEYFEEGGCGVAFEVVTYLVNLIEHEHRVGGAYTFHRIDNTPGHSSDICASMPAYLSLIVQAAERYTLVFTPQGFSYRSAERGLTYSGRAHKAQYRGFD